MVSQVALQRMLDERAVERLMALYCRACDRVDRELLHSLFWPDAIVEHPPFKGSAFDFCENALDFLGMIGGSLHQLGNSVVEVDGDQAHLEAYFIAWHRIPKGPVGSGKFATEVFAAHNLDLDEDIFMGGRYIKWCERRDDVWKFSRQIGFVEWERWETSSSRSDVGALSPARHDKTDPVYRRLQKETG